jgi:carboxymethylenebutenolidase
VVAAKEELSPTRPVAPIDYTADLRAPLLGLFGNDDNIPRPRRSTGTRRS